MSAARGTSLRMPALSPVTRDGAPEGGSGDVFVHMRNYLISVRRYHKVLFWVVMLAFAVLIGVGVYKLVNGIQTTLDYVQTVGSAGIAGVLLWFGQRVLWASRVSQLSLALFESQVAEVSESLSEIPKSASTKERRKIRAEIWNDFRSGLNRIWLVERELLREGGAAGVNRTEAEQNRAVTDPPG